MTGMSIKQARLRTTRAIVKLKHIDRQLTKQGCIGAYVHFKTKTDKNGERIVSDVMYLRWPKNKKTGKRKYKHVGDDPDFQDAVRAKVDRFNLRKELRACIAMLKHELRLLESQMRSCVRTFNELAGTARSSVQKYTRRYRES